MKMNKKEKLDLLEKADGKLRSMSRSRSQGAKKVLTETEERMKRLKQKMQKEWKNSFQGSEADRRIPCKMPKHLVTGIRGNGKTDRRWEGRREEDILLLSKICYLYTVMCLLSINIINI